MSTFTETALLKKLSELNSSQQSIQTLSLWLIHHRKHYVAIVQSWLQELQKAPESKKLTFMYLANDVIQNSKKKGPEYGKQFATVLPKVFTHVAGTCTGDKLFGCLGRILHIWEDRGVYDAKTISEYRARLNKEYKEPNTVESAGENGKPAKSDKPEKAEKAPRTDEATNNNTNASTNSNSSKEKRHSKRKTDEHKSAGSKRSRALAEETNSGTAEEHQNGAAEHLSPQMPLGDAPEPEELIRALLDIENSASGDVATRERIANLRPEISDVSCVERLQDKEQARALSEEVNEAIELLNEYNARLAAEMEERTRLTAMLHNFAAEQRGLLEQAEQRYEVWQAKLEALKIGVARLRLLKHKQEQKAQMRDRNRDYRDSTSDTIAKRKKYRRHKRYNRDYHNHSDEQLSSSSDTDMG